MINVSFEICSKIMFQFDEVLLVNKLVRLYRDQQYVKLQKLKYIVDYLTVDVSKAPSRILRKTFTVKKSTFAENRIFIKTLLWCYFRAST